MNKYDIIVIDNVIVTTVEVEATISSFISIRTSSLHELTIILYRYIIININRNSNIITIKLYYTIIQYMLL